MAITRLTFENFIWLILQFLLYERILDLPELNDGHTLIAILISTFLTLTSVISKIFSVVSESYALKEEPIVFLMSSMTAKSKWLPY